VSRRGVWVMLALFGALLAGCAGGARSSVPAGRSAGPLQGAKGQATFRIAVPKQAATAKTRAPRYVSPATTQLAINIEQGEESIAGYPVTVALTPTSAGCTSTLATTYCQLTIALGPGSYTATLTAEDASGTPLSSAQSIPFTVTAESDNVIAIVLSGIPHALQIAAGAPAMHESGALAFTLYGSAAQQVIVTALDADGNTIVGPGAPTYSASWEYGNGWSAATPSSTSPNTIAITPSGVNGSTAAFVVVATYADATCSQSGALCEVEFTIKNDIQTLFVANSNYASSTVTEYAPPYTGTPTTISSGVNQPTGLGLNSAADLFVTNEDGPNVTMYAPPYTGVPTTISSGVDYPTALVFDPLGNLFVANYDGPTVTVYAPPYNGAPTTISNGVHIPWALVLNGAEDLFVADYNGSVTEYAPPYTGSPLVTISGVVEPIALALDGAGDLFVASSADNEVFEYAPPYTGAAITTISTGVQDPDALLLDGAGDLFVANNSTVTEYAPPYTGSPTTISSGVAYPAALAIDAAGNLFVANSSTVTEYAPPYTGAPLATITNGVHVPVKLLLTP
jgi:hypothetical protein